MSGRPLRLGGFVTVILGVILLVLGFTSGRGGDFDAEVSRLSGASGPVLVIESIELTTTVRGGGETSVGTIDPPSGQAMWVQGFDRVRPGSVGTAVVAGHVVYDGEDDIFARLPAVDVGQEVRLVAGDESLDFVVTRAEIVDKHALTEDDEVWGPNSSTRQLVVVTCDDALGYGSDGHRRANYVVVAEAVTD